ncbi:hypothetical protein PVL29_007749 [Vitis rotundifolia]|uniref:Retrotransposon Copia-like N-terminal domain-containing protein n=1 Tax=Vitis rotundifolia TaxID=103349 RepID=A0AA39A0P5_VITRO|nr:hypothetical protein PVL29_007749 [Vitis rotundifolia]
MITIKLSFSNYLLWKSQLRSLLESQDLLGYIDGTLVPPPHFEPATSTILSTKYLAWKATDQRLLYLLLFSLTVEAIVVLMKRNTKPVAEYAHTFKTLCDQLHAIGRPVEDTDKVHWFLRGLGTDFSVFFYRSDGSHSSLLFCRFSRRPPRYQICRMEGHYANRCNQRYGRTDSSAHLAEAFNISCSFFGPEASDWFLDTGASAHMTTDHLFWINPKITRVRTL